MFVKPAQGLVVRDPDLKDLLPAEGRHVSDDSMFWHRRLRDKDVELAEPPAEDGASRNALKALPADASDKTEGNE
jgi:hypothetical protein